MSESAWQRELHFSALPESSRILIDRGSDQVDLRGPTWRRVRRGFYVPDRAGRAPGNRRLVAAQRILDVAPALAGQAALGTWAAAYILGVDWLDGRNPHTMEDLPIDIIAPDVRRRQPRNLQYRFTELLVDDVLIRDGLRVTSPSRTAFDGARWARSLEDAVVFIDSVAHFIAFDLSDFKEYVGGRAHWTGVQQAMNAVDLASPDVRSTWETRLRLCWLLDAGLPPPLVNVPIFDQAGDFLGIGDLFDPESGLVAEFDGDQHRDPEQHRLDNIREEKLESANLVVVRSDKTDVRRARRQLVSRLQVGYRRGQCRDRCQDSWTLDKPDWWQRRQRAKGQT